MIRKILHYPRPIVRDLVAGPVVEGDPMLRDSPRAEVEGHDEEPGDDDQLQDEGEEREEQAGDGLANCFGALNNHKSHVIEMLLFFFKARLNRVKMSTQTCHTRDVVVPFLQTPSINE